jgi:O-antigen/teichoic acid export membrane protein
MVLFGSSIARWGSSAPRTTRVLVPADFGLVAMAMSLVALLELFGAFRA